MKLSPRRALVPAALALVLLLGLAAAGFTADLLKGVDRRAFERQLDLFVEVVQLVRSEYVDEVKMEKLFSGALSGMLRSLDPYSQFLDAEAYKDLKSDTEGQFGGVGVEVGAKAGVLHVIAPLDESPASRAGLKAGDVIVKIDGEAMRDLPLSDAVHRLRGAPGTHVRLTVMREDSDKLLDFDVKRERIAIRSVKEARILEGGIAYLRLSAFQENTAADFDAAISRLRGEGMTALILDVRNNTGGLLLAAIEVAERFVPAGKTVIATRGRNPKKGQKYVSGNKEPLRLHPLVILVNKGSASGSEILAAAIQDHKLGVIVGQKTFGKASIQTLVPLPDGTAIRMTTSKYETPAGRILHEAGVKPDVEIEPADPNGKDPALDRARSLARELSGVPRA